MNTNESMMTIFARVLIRYRWRWIIPVVVSGAAAVLWTVLHQPVWQARQGLMVRDVTSLDSSDLGRFPDGESRKIAQEVVLELSRRPEVLERALRAVGPPSSKPFPQGKPTPKHLAALEEAVKVGAPKGAELGRTDMIYLSVKDHSPARAKALAAALTSAIDQELRRLRQHQAESLVNELSEVVAVAESDLSAATAKLVAIEHQAGADLAELRILTQTGSGEGLLRQLLLSVDNDRRRLQITLEQRKRLLAFLNTAQQNPDAILSAPNALFELQPSLRSLKQGLTTAQLAVAQLKGQFTSSHPKVQSAIRSEQEIRDRLRQSLQGVAAALAEDVKVSESQLSLLEAQRSDLLARNARISKLRAPYDATLAQVAQATSLVRDAREKLAEARARLRAADTVSLITRVGQPTTGNRPAGPRKALVILGGLLGGVFIGAGWLVLTVPPAEFGVGSRQSSIEPAPEFHAQRLPPEHNRESPAADESPAEADPASPATVWVGPDWSGTSMTGSELTS